MSLFRRPRVAIIIQPRGLVRQSRVRARRRKREQKCLNGGIEVFNLKGHIVYRFLLPRELIHPRLSILADAIGAGIG